MPDCLDSDDFDHGDDDFDHGDDECAECGEPLHPCDYDGLCADCAFDAANEDDPGQDGAL